MNQYSKDHARKTFKNLRAHIYKCIQILCSNGVDCSEIDRITAELSKAWKETLDNPKFMGKHKREIYYKIRQNERRSKKLLSEASVFDKIKSLIINKKQKRSRI